MYSGKLLLTQSLLSSWQWSLARGDDEGFWRSLRREPISPNKAMLNGRQFEEMVQACANGYPPDEGHKWYSGIVRSAGIVRGGAYQVKLYRDIEVDGVQFLLYGILDFLRAGVIYDTKFSVSYGSESNNNANKYLDSPQTPMYLYLVPEAKKFIYVISDGKYVYTETYMREDVPPIIHTIRVFMDYLDKRNMAATYCEHWKAKY